MKYCVITGSRLYININLKQHKSEEKKFEGRGGGQVGRSRFGKYSKFYVADVFPTHLIIKITFVQFFDQVEIFTLAYAMGVYFDTHTLRIGAYGTKTDSKNDVIGLGGRGYSNYDG